MELAATLEARDAQLAVPVAAGAAAAAGAPAAGGAQPEQQQPEAQSDEAIDRVTQRRIIAGLREELKNIKKDKKAYKCVNKIMFWLLVFFFVTTMVLGSLTGIRMAGSSLPCSSIQWAWNASGCNKTGALAQDKVCKVP